MQYLLPSFIIGNISEIENCQNLNLMVEIMFAIDSLIYPIFVIDILLIFGKVIIHSRIIYYEKV